MGGVRARLHAALLLAVLLALQGCCGAAAVAERQAEAADAKRRLSRRRRLQPSLGLTAPIDLNNPQVAAAMMRTNSRAPPGAPLQPDATPIPLYYPRRPPRGYRRRLSQQQPQQPPPAASGRCVCAFDFDNTLRIERGGRDDVPAPDAKAIISDCKARGFGVAIASANADQSKLQPVLRRVDSSTFDDAFFATGAYQTGDARKSRSLRHIASYYGTDTACLMLFDDSWYNAKYAREVGAVWQQVNRGSGVALGDYKAAAAALARQCACQR